MQTKQAKKTIMKCSLTFELHSRLIRCSQCVIERKCIQSVLAEKTVLCLICRFWSEMSSVLLKDAEDQQIENNVAVAW